MLTFLVLLVAVVGGAALAGGALAAVAVMEGA